MKTSVGERARQASKTSAPAIEGLDAGVKITYQKPGFVLPESPGIELDLRGQTTEEALEKLERYIDSAYLAGLPWVRIIHGKGTGKLRQAVRQALNGHPQVKSFELGGDKEGGEGVTVAKLLSA